MRSSVEDRLTAPLGMKLLTLQNFSWKVKGEAVAIAARMVRDTWAEQGRRHEEVDATIAKV